MILPKTKCRMLERAIKEYIDSSNFDSEELEELNQVYDKVTLVLQGDASGLLIEQVYH